MTDTTPQDQLLLKSIKWRTAAGWTVVAIIGWRYLAHPMASTLSVSLGNDPLPDLPNIEWQDVLAIIGLPVGGAYADSMNDD